jgi:poly(ADP-ribose) glycohydrolase ARH3
MPPLRDRFRGCILGGVVGDVAGAVVEAESPGYIARTYRSVDDILAAEAVPELTGPDWQVGRYTDDTQMTLCVAEWLLADESPSAESLLARFSAAFESFRRYGPSTESILRSYPHHKAQWRELATAGFPHGSYGNGSAMRVAPIGLAYFKDPRSAVAVAIESSRPTHTHPWAFQGAVLQTLAVSAAASTDNCTPSAFLPPLRTALRPFADLMQDTSPFNVALDTIEDGLRRGASCSDMAAILGTGVTVHEAVPMAIYCFLRHPDSYECVLHEAIFIGGDTDTIGSMAGSLAGAFLGVDAIPSRWQSAIREKKYTPHALEVIADRLLTKFALPQLPA